MQAVRKDSKQRFNFIEENGMFLIRANQGHSIEVINYVEVIFLSCLWFQFCDAGSIRNVF